MISVTDPDAMIPPLQEAKDAGIDIIGIDGDLLRRRRSWRRTSSRTTWSGARWPPSRSSRPSARTSAATCIGLSNDPGSPIGEQREQGFSDELAKYSGVPLPRHAVHEQRAGRGGDDRVDDGARRMTTWWACTR